MGASFASALRFASSFSAARRRPPATTSNLPSPRVRTCRFCKSPCASILAASSSMPLAAPVLRTLAAEMRRAFRGIILIFMARLSFVGGFLNRLRSRRVHKNQWRPASRG